MSEEQGSVPPGDSFEVLLQEGSFEEMLAALEEVVARLERGRIPLAEAVQWYETGLRLSRRCQELLEQAELRIEMLDQQYDSSEWSGSASAENT